MEFAQLLRIEGSALLLILAGLAVLGGLGVLAWRRFRLDDEERRRRNLPFLVFDAEDFTARPAAPVPPQKVPPFASTEENGIVPRTTRPSTLSATTPPPSPRPEPPPAEPVRAEPKRNGLAATATANEKRANGNGAEMGALAVDMDGTLQLLPGRLEPMNGGQEVRFLKLPGVTRFTLGRSDGPPHTHIRLRAPTASRLHAVMVFENSRWRIGNMSQTNRVILNGAPLDSDEPRELQDGDRIELGEMAFVFRTR